MRWILGAALLLVGCSEYEWHEDRPAVDGTDLTSTADPTGADGSGGANNNGGGAGNGGDGGLNDGGGNDDGPDFPEEFIDDDCAGGIQATWYPGEIYVLANSSGPAVGQLEVPQGGVYEVYDFAIAESGDRQRNESAYIRIPNAANPDGAPMFGNCSGEYVVPDSDNAGPVPTGMTQYLGTFRLEAGANTVEMYHYCWLVEDGGCTDFLDPTAGHECDNGGNPNSVHMTGQALCLRPM